MRIFIILTFFTILFTPIFGQENTPMRVLHGTAVPQNMAVHNIHIDENDQKYIGGKDQVFQLFSADNATPFPKDNKKWHLLLQNDGNAKRAFPLELIQTILNPDSLPQAPIVNAATFNDKTKMLWLGTDTRGLFQLLVSDDNASLVKQYTAENSKLKSNAINAVLVDKYGRVWAGSDQGILMREADDEDFKLFEKREKILDITTLGPDVWILGTGILWRADERNRWIPGDVDPKLYQGNVRDIQYDSEGRLWVASNIITRYDVIKDKVEKFDSSNGFTSKDVSVIRVDQQDALWVGTYDKGIFLIEPQAKITVSLKVLNWTGCDNRATGIIESKVIGGTAPYTYKWSNSKTTDKIENLGMGLYALTVTDATGQTKVAEAQIAPAQIQATFTELQPASRTDTKDGKVSLQVSGGQTPYTFEWDNGETGVMAENLSPGKHQVIITDRHNCKGMAQVEVTTLPPPEVPVEEPVVAEEEIVAASTPVSTPTPPATPTPPPTPEPAPEPEPLLTPLDVKITYQAMLDCSDGVADAQVSVTGGKSPYQYLWSSNNTTTSQIKALSAGDYSLTVTDAVGNTNVQTIKIKSPEPLKAVASVLEAASDESSRNGKAKVGVKGGNGNYKIRWDNEETSATAKKLKFGKHTVTVTDEKGCETTAMVNMDKKIIAALDARKLIKGQTIQINQLYFDADSTDVKPTSLPVLNEMFTFLKSNPNIVVEIGGHTNNVPKHDYCDALSTARAKSVVDFLTNKGVPAKQLTYKGYGKRKPLVSNRTASGRKKNQRVEIKVLEVGDS